MYEYIDIHVYIYIYWYLVLKALSHTLNRVIDWDPGTLASFEHTCINPLPTGEISC